MSRLSIPLGRSKVAYLSRTGQTFSAKLIKASLKLKMPRKHNKRG